MTWSPIHLRIAGSAYLGTLALIVAHVTNAFVANALYVPLDRSTPPAGHTEAVAPSDQAQQSVDVILHSGLFELPPEQQAKAGNQTAAPPPPPPIGAARKVSLLGTVFGKSGGMMAILEDLASKKQELYRVGTEIPAIGTLAIIEKERVLFKSGPSEEWLDLTIGQQMRAGAPGYAPPPPVQPPAAPTRRVLDRREVTGALNDPTRLLTQAQAIPYLSDGKLDGFRLYNVVPSGFFDKIGLQTNDIVQRINGVELRDPGMLLSLFQQLRNERTVRVDMVRNNARQTLTYDIR
jgi:general secretion pathway protein C